MALGEPSRPREGPARSLPTHVGFFSHRYHGYCNWAYSNTEAPKKCADPRCLAEAGQDEPEGESLLIVKRERVEAKIEAQAQQVHDAVQAQIAQGHRALAKALAKAPAKTETQIHPKMQAHRRAQALTPEATTQGAPPMNARRRQRAQDTVGAPAKRKRYTEEEKTWVCPYPGCGHRMNPSARGGFTAGQIFHVANHHRRAAFGACSCGHGCPACVPHLIRDATGNQFRLAVVEANGAQLGELLKSGEGFPEDLSKSHLSMREAFLHHAITKMNPENRQSFCQAAIGVDVGNCTLSPPAQHIREVLGKARDGKFQAVSPPCDDE